MIVIDPALTEEDAVAENSKLLDLIKENEGEIINSDKWGKKKLAFEIEKKNEGFYFVNYFMLDPQKIAIIDRYYKLSDKIFRFNMIVKEN